ncbi:MAG TPA: UDP-N-acetylmuramoyl-L-alanyl-D-glutamate--2,6-diaminopimelate ligase [Rhizomicrobium sp.]|nr:UDP-N-acetylmuramoyl-L-alanyl-D-glutamate--2,6-diaminopimelate ligase [Rhizomicrobium sp.]
MDLEELIKRSAAYPIVTDDVQEMCTGGIFVFGGDRPKVKQDLIIALDAGASFVVTDEELELVPPSMQVFSPDLRRTAAKFARAFYGNPGMNMTIVGITGTSGKTTSAYLVESIFKAAGYKTGAIGTSFIRYGDKTQSSLNTTPGAFNLNRALAAMTETGCAAVVLEVSSHGILRDRTFGVPFDGALFTNLSREHLDEHGTMEAYYDTKRRLFTQYAAYSRDCGKSPKAAVNFDCSYGRQLLKDLAVSMAPGGAHSVGFSLRESRQDYDGTRLELGPDGIRGAVIENCTPKKTEMSVASPLIGEFNAQNILGVVALLRQLDLKPEVIERGLTETRSIPGRMTYIDTQKGIAVYVDFAHKPGALNAALSTLRMITKRRLICVFGCGGFGDPGKRSIMGRIAAIYSDIVIVTADNSRGEPFEAIAADIVRDITPGEVELFVVDDRKQAIRQALVAARSGDVILIAGRGAEESLEVYSEQTGPTVIEFDDRVIAARLAAEVLTDN